MIAKPSTGYYCLIQYCPDLGRLEAANVGVLLFCPERSFLQAKTVASNARIRRFFGSEQHDWEQVNLLKRSLEDRLANEVPNIATVDNLRDFIALRANLLQISPPRPIKVFDPQQDLNSLFEEFFGKPEHREPERSWRRRVQEKLEKAGLGEKLVKNVPITIPLLETTEEVPFAFQNGRFNLLAPVPFATRDPKNSLNRACRYAVEGDSLYETPHPEFGELQLCVIAKFRPHAGDTPDRIQAVFDKHHVKLYRAEQMKELIEEIRATGKNRPISR